MKNDTQDKKVSNNRRKKEVLVAELSEKVNKSKSFVFTDYQGLTHLQLEKFKKAVKKMDAEYVATKNSLVKIALKDKIDIEKEKDQFTKPTATLFIYNDIVAPLKELTALMKELNLPKIKFGMFEGKAITEQEIKKIASLPPLDVLRAQLVGGLQSPIAGFHRALNWNLQKFVMTLNAISQQKSQG